MYLPPQGPDPTPEQVRELDDTFLTSDPYGYFISRVGMLHTWARQGEPPDDVFDGVSSGRSDLASIVGAVMRNEDADVPPTTMIVSSQVALDAFALRHHLAEAVVRLFVTIVNQRIDTEPKPVSLWAASTDDEFQSVLSLLDAAVKATNDLPEGAFATIVLPPGFVVDEESLPVAEMFVVMCWKWLEHAVRLLAPGEFDLTTAHNKVKHGLVVRGRADLRTALSLVGPGENGDVPLSAFDPDKSVDVLKLPSIEFLSRPRLRERPRKEVQGLEVTQMALDYRAMLAEVVVLAHVYGSLFHVAAEAHFADHDPPSGVTIAPHPGMVGEMPPVGFAGPPVGTRYPITEPNGDSEARPAMFANPDGSLTTFRIAGPRIAGRIVDDRSHVAESSDESTA